MGVGADTGWRGRQSRGRTVGVHGVEWRGRESLINSFSAEFNSAVPRRVNVELSRQPKG